MIFQDLEDLKVACVEAADKQSQIKDFEVGVFCGKYKTAVPEDYFEHMGRPQGSKRRKTAASADGPSATLVANGGPVNVAGPREALTDGDKGAKSPENRDDVRYVSSGVCDRIWTTNDSTVFTTSQINLETVEVRFGGWFEL